MPKTQQELINQGYEALVNGLGPVEAVRFLQHFSHGKGDYTKERHQRPTPSIDQIVKQMQQLPPAEPNQYKELI
jgi:hypothetical protein